VDIYEDQRMARGEGSPLKILIYGEAVKHGVAAPLREAFERLGHNAGIFDWPRYLFSARGRSFGNRVLDRLLFHHVARRINKDLVRAVAGGGYDLVIVIRGNHVFPGTVDEARNLVPLVVNWNSDDFFNPLNSTGYMLRSFGKYDCIFTSRGHLREEYRARGAKRFEVLNWYCRPDLMAAGDNLRHRRYSRDITFIGSWSRRREDMLGSLADFGIAIYGSSWNKAGRSFRKRVPCRGPVYSEGMMELMASSRINLNILTRENRDTTNIRNFEIPSSGAFQLSERSDAILEIFEEGREIACFGDARELKEKCAYYLKHDGEREEIAANGYRRLTGGGHDITDRARQILDSLFGEKR